MLKKPLENNNIIGVFNSETILVDAIKKIRKNSIKIKNVFTPFPVNEVIHELGLSTRMPYFAFGYGAFGTISIFAFLYYSSVINFPIMIGGKPSLSMSFIIILFVMTINIGVVLSLLTFFGVQKLYPGKNPQIIHDEITDDKFVIVIERSDEMTKAEADQIMELLLSSGAIEVANKKNIENF